MKPSSKLHPRWDQSKHTPSARLSAYLWLHRYERRTSAQKLLNSWKKQSKHLFCWRLGGFSSKGMTPAPFLHLTEFVLLLYLLSWETADTTGELIYGNVYIDRMHTFHSNEGWVSSALLIHCDLQTNNHRTVSIQIAMQANISPG